jgi:hypothetical protein
VPTIQDLGFREIIGQVIANVGYDESCPAQ